MHELALTQGIVDICLQHAAGRPVSTVVIEIGRLSDVVPEAVTFCFEACSKDTLLAAAQLEIRRPEGRGCCVNCSANQPLVRLYDPCQYCGSYALKILGGQEMRVVEIEVAD